MIPALRPMNLGEILDRTFQIYRSRFLAFVAIGLASPATTLAVFVLRNYGPQPILTTSSKSALKALAGWAPADWPATCARFLAWPVIVYLTSSALFNEDPTLGDAVNWCKARWQSWLGLACALWAVCELLPSVLIQLLATARPPSWSSGVGGNGWTTFASSYSSSLLGVLHLLAGYFLTVSVSLSVPILVIDRAPVFRALLLGWRLVRHNRIRVLSAQLLADVLNGTLIFSLIFVASFTARLAFNGFFSHGMIQQIRYGIVMGATQIVSIFIAAIYPISVTLFYYDQRIRHEGYDIEHMMAAAGLNPTALPTADTPATPALPHEGHA
jgi:hypothetical protein